MNPETLHATDDLLTRDRLAVSLTACGFSIAAATLSTKACRGEGPPVELFGNKPLYRWGRALEWARNRRWPRQGISRSEHPDQMVAAA